MPIVSAIVSKAVVTVSNNLVKWGFNKLSGKRGTDFERELTLIIFASIEEYEKQFQIPETNLIPFYHSQTFLDLLLEFRFTSQIDQGWVETTLKENPLIIPPNTQQLRAFFDIFDAHIRESKDLARFNLNDNYKEEIFHISAVLRRFRDDVFDTILELKQDVKTSERSAVLTEEWSKQIDEIYQSIKLFKPFTALDRLGTLEARIKLEGVANNNLLARITHLRAFCLIQCEETTRQSEIGELLVRAYRLQPTNADYKANAGIAYATIGEADKAHEIADSILSIDEFDSSAWLIRVLCAKSDFATVLAAIPPIVKGKASFQFRLYHWLTSKRHIEKSSILPSFGITIEIDQTEPLVVTSNNLNTWLIKAFYLLSSYYEQSTHISAQLHDPKAKDDLNFQRGVAILTSVQETIQTTELEAFLASYWYELHIGKFLITADGNEISAMEKWFAKINPRRPFSVIRMFQAFNSLGTQDGVVKACRLLEEENLYAEEPELHFFIAMAYGSLRDSASSERHFLQYVHAKTPIPWQSMVNVLLFLRKSAITMTEQGISNIFSVVDSGSFASPLYKDLLAIALFFRFQRSMTEDEVRRCISNLAANLDPADIDLYLTVVYGWCMLNEFQKAKDYLDNWVNLKEESEALKLYCKVLFSIDGFKPKLLELLEYWRSHFHPDHELAEIELHLYEVAHQWEELTVVAQWAVQQWPQWERPIYLLFKAFQNVLNLEGISANARVVQGRLFNNANFVPPIYGALLKASLHQEALDLLYQHARIKENISCRQAYFTATIHIPQGYFVDYPEVAVGHYVFYQTGNVKSSIQITAANQQAYPAKYLLGKKPGETFRVPVQLTDDLQEVTILRVCNQYTALFQELIIEAENPLSGLGIQAFKMEDSNPENISKSLIAAFGVTGTLQRDRIQTELEKYHKGEISFSEVTNSVFRRHPIDAYFILSDKNGKAFKAISPALSRTVRLEPNDKFILDCTALCLFYELSQQFPVAFSHKFVVSRYTRELVQQLLQEAKDAPPSEYSISINLERVTPHFYGDNFKENRIQQLQSILDWINARCEIERSEETLNLIVASKTEDELDPYVLSLIENRLLASSPNHYLLSNDLMYYLHLKIGADKCLSPLCYLSVYHQENLDQILDFMLEKNYVGIPMSASVLTRELFKMLSDQQNKFNICIENLQPNWNPDPSNIIEVVKFAKSLYTSTVLATSTRQQIVSVTFSSIAAGLSPQFIQLLRALLKTEFRMMGRYLDEVLELYQTAQNAK